MWCQFEGICSVSSGERNKGCGKVLLGLLVLELAGHQDFELGKVIYWLRWYGLRGGIACGIVCVVPLYLC